MILVITSANDYSVKSVLEWIRYFKVSFIRVNKETDTIDLVDIKIEGVGNLQEICVKIKINDVVFNLKQIEMVWYRGGVVRIADFFNDEDAVRRRYDLRDNIAYFLSAYSTAKLELTSFLLSQVPRLGNNAQGRFNKLVALHHAIRVGIETPETLCTTRKEEVLSFYNRHDKHIITKSLDLNFEFNNTANYDRYYQYTSEVPAILIEDLPEEFPLTLFQKKVDKKYEIRTFFIENNCYSVAIMSQFNQKTQIDYRKYDYEKMNRVLPYQLPKDVEHKVCELMRRCNLSTGSIDIIRSVENKFVFLEVNPIGQFGYNSKVCNFYLEQKIAQFLIKNNTMIV